MSTVTLEIEDGVALVQLNRPAVHNAVDHQTFLALIRTAAEVRGRSDVRVVVLSGIGKSFCAGIDTAAFAALESFGARGDWRPADADAEAAAGADVDGMDLTRAQRAVMIWRTIPAPVIAAVRGAALGFGLQLALAADIRIVSEDVRFAALEVNWGLFPDAGGTSCFRASSGPVGRWSCASLVGASMWLRLNESDWLPAGGRTHWRGRSC